MTEQPAYDEHYFRRYYPNVTDRLSAIEAYRADSYIFRPTEVWLAQLDWLVDEVKRLRALVAAPQFQFTLRLGRPAMVIECDCIVCRQGAMGVVKEWEAKEKAEQERHELRQQVADLERERDDAIEWRDSWRKHYEEAQVEMQSLRQRVETLEEALRWYADEDNYPNRCGDCWVRADIQDDGGQKAHAALASQPTPSLQFAAEAWFASLPSVPEGEMPQIEAMLQGALDRMRERHQPAKGDSNE